MVIGVENVKGGDRNLGGKKKKKKQKMLRAQFLFLFFLRDKIFSRRDNADQTK